MGVFGMVMHVWNGYACLEWLCIFGMVMHVWDGCACLEWFRNGGGLVRNSIS